MKLKDSRRRAPDKNAPAEGHVTAEQNQFPEAPDPLDPGGTGNPNLERDDRTLRLHDFVFLSDNSKCWLIRTAHIWFLEACGDNTRVHLPEGTVLIRRLLRDCERRLDSSTFFRATRDFIINLTHVKQTRLLDSSRVLFVLPDGREVIASGRQNVLFRKLRAL